MRRKKIIVKKNKKYSYYTENIILSRLTSSIKLSAKMPIYTFQKLSAVLYVTVYGNELLYARGS